MEGNSHLVWMNVLHKRLVPQGNPQRYVFISGNLEIGEICATLKMFFFQHNQLKILSSKWWSDMRSSQLIGTFTNQVVLPLL